ncbi:hypothetical protein Q1695_010743 [Nippostrongylus brasiliensis]|nr:hypothetical protein Q1695_010743 [Nippostrongylus brasiliensis]
MDEFDLLALLDRCGSLEALCTIFLCHPPLIDISLGLKRTQNFVKEFIKVCQMPITAMMELDLFKSMEGCPAHFLPPYTVDEKAEYYKTLAIKTLVTLYKALKCEGDVAERMDTTTSTVNEGDVSLDMIACVTIETLLCPIPSVVRTVEEAITPIDAKCVLEVGEHVLIFRAPPTVQLILAHVPTENECEHMV